MSRQILRRRTRKRLKTAPAADTSTLAAVAPPHTDASFMRCVAIRHDASMHLRGRIVTDSIATDEKRIRAGRASIIQT